MRRSIQSPQNQSEVILVDTCIWIEFLKGANPVYGQLKKLLDNRDVLTFARKMKINRIYSLLNIDK